MIYMKSLAPPPLIRLGFKPPLDTKFCSYPLIRLGVKHHHKSLQQLSLGRKFRIDKQSESFFSFLTISFLYLKRNIAKFHTQEFHEKMFF